MKRILFIFFALMLFAGIANGRTYALILGVSNYQDENSVQWTTASAKKFAELMKKATKDVSILTSRNVNTTNVMSKLNAIAKQAQKGDKIVLFYSGHGLEGGLYMFDGVLTYDEIISALSASKATEKYCFIEACHSGSVAGSQPNSEKWQSKAKTNNIAFFTGCRPDESSYVDPIIGAGVFSQGLIKGLRGKADKNRDKQISVLELFEYAYKDVVNRKNSQQHPQLIAPKAMHNNIIMKW